MRNILIADDNTQILDVLKEYALREGFQVYTAESGKAALEAFSRREYEAVLLDVMMPEIDGFEVCRQIRKKSMVPIIMITARGEDFERIMGLDIGADDYVVKPFSPSEVMARLRAILRRMDASGRKRKPGRPWKRRMQIERNIQEGTYRKKHTEWQSDGKIDLYKKNSDFRSSFTPNSIEKAAKSAQIWNYTKKVSSQIQNFTIYGSWTSNFLV